MDLDEGPNKRSPLLEDGNGKYLVQFRYTLVDFLLPELDSLLEMIGLKPAEVYEKESFDPKVPFLRVKLPNDQMAKELCERSILIKGIFQIWGVGKSYEEVCESIRKRPLEEKEFYFQKDQMWSIAASSFGYKFSQREMADRREKLLAGNHEMAFQGKVKLSGERNMFWIIEHVPIDFLSAAQIGEDSLDGGAGSGEGTPTTGKSKTQLKKEQRMLRRIKLRGERGPKHKRKRTATRTTGDESVDHTVEVDGEAEEEEVECDDLQGEGEEENTENVETKKSKQDDDIKSGDQSEAERKIVENRKTHERIRSELEPEYIFFVREIARPEKVTKYTLKKRVFLGPTSMENEMAFLMANQGLVRKGSLAYDPFVGTGSILVPCTVFGAKCFGSDIDYLTLKGKGDKNMFSTFDQYTLPHPEIIRLDFSPTGRCLREIDGGFLDAIICDPPYGIRAGARKAGTTKEIKPIPEDLRSTHIPPTQPYDTGDLMVDLVDGAARFLKVGGRLVYLLPVLRTIYSDRVLPRHECFEIISNSEQQLRFPVSRRLVTMKKIREYDYCKAEEYVRASRAELEMPSFDQEGWDNEGQGERDCEDVVSEGPTAADAIKLVRAAFNTQISTREK